MKTRSATLAMAALVLWLVPSGSFAQGNSGKSRLTICHVPPGNPDARRTMSVPEPAWGAHESHGDHLGPCDGYRERASDDYGDEYGDDTKRAKKVKKAKKKDGAKTRSGSDGEDADDGIETDDRAGEGEEVDEADRRARREQRSAERRARREQTSRDRDGKATDESVTEEDSASDGADAVEAGGADTGTENADAVEAGGSGAGSDDAQAADGRTERRARTGERSKRGTQPASETEASPEEDPGFFRGMRRFFGFGGDEAGDAAE